MATTTVQERLAMLAVADHARDASDCRLLLEALGLITPRADAGPPQKAEVGPNGRFRAYAAGCRCTECKAANAAAQRRRRRRAATEPRRADMAGHGKASTYKNHGCRCEACRTAHARWQQDYEQRKRAAA